PRLGQPGRRGRPPARARRRGHPGRRPLRRLPRRGAPVRLLPTSDWPVGRAIRGRSRAAEHRAVLAEIAAVADRDEVDLVVVAGDLFDTAAPTPEAERIVYRALLDLAAGGRPVVVVAGNHDSAGRVGAGGAGG